ncbi:recombinase family protein [Petralouisia muris]|uniref:recombinase family protein n=1 Tax=Petralouisia muris TaxID=3032872 RepID=UPI0023B830B4|nr:recombinase family protein [Petralouisia muris]
MESLAMYLRLSIEDDGDKDESNSISNQRKQIYKYIHHDSKLSKYEVVEFCDDGYSGTNMERPGMQKMLKEVKANKIRCIIVKDMSRFSRDYIEMGTYLNQIFPFMGIRFISINDRYDSREHHGNTIEIDTAFQTLLYDLYSKDVSVKVKASFENKCANGEYVFGQVPFGYEKSKEVKNAVVVNESEAVIVRYIFSLAMQGKSSTQIARQLHEENVPTIMQMRKPDKEYTDGKVHSWSENSVRRMLNNRFYLGEMAYGKSVRKSVGSKNGVSVPMEDWKVIKDHHEALISEEIFMQLSLFRPDYSTKRNREKHPLTGKLYCGGCGYSLNYKPLTGKNRYRRFECRKHALLQIPECCTYISADILEETVLFMLNKELMLRGDAVKQSQSLTSFQKAGIASLKKKLEKYQSEMKQARERKDSLYERYALSGLTKEAYQNDSNEISEQIALLSVKIEEITGKLAVMEAEYQKTEEDMKQIIRYSHIDKLTQDVVDTFIKKVYAYKDKRVEIEWNFSVDQGISQAKST